MRATMHRSPFNKLRTPILHSLVYGSALSVITASVHGAVLSTHTWNGQGADSNWSTALDWTSSSTPSNDGKSDVILSGSSRLTPIVDTPWSIDSLTFGTGKNSFNMSGSALTIGAGGVSNLSSTVQTFKNAVVLASDQAWSGGTGSGGYLFCNGPISTGGHTLTLTGSNNILLQGSIGGSGSLVASTSNSVIISNINTYSGGTSITQGAIYVYSDTALGATGSPVTLSNGGEIIFDPTQGSSINRDITLDSGGGQVYGFFPQGTTLGLPGPIHGLGSLTLSASGPGAYVQFSGTNSYTGGTIINGFNVLGTTSSIQGNISMPVGFSEIVFQQNTNGIFSGNISGIGGVTLQGSGLIAFTGTSTYNNYTQVTAGTLQVNGSLGATPIQVSAGASLGGTGYIAGGAAIAAGGKINLVDGKLGTLTFSDPNAGDTVLTLGGSFGSPSQLSFEVGSTSDNILVTAGKIAVTGGGGVITIDPLAGFQPGTYDLFDFPSNSATGLNLLTLSSKSMDGYALALATTNTSVQLVVSAVPEPACLGVILCAVGTTGLCRRPLRKDQQRAPREA